jgi:hypothetical protein
MKLMHAYVDRIAARSTRDAAVRQRFLEVLHMTKPLTVLFHPAFLFKALFDVGAEKPKR